MTSVPGGRASHDAQDGRLGTGDDDRARRVYLGASKGMRSAPLIEAARAGG